MTDVLVIPEGSDEIEEVAADYESQGIHLVGLDLVGFGGAGAVFGSETVASEERVVDDPDCGIVVLGREQGHLARYDAYSIGPMTKQILGTCVQDRHCPLKMRVLGDHQWLAGEASG